MSAALTEINTEWPEPLDFAYLAQLPVPERTFRVGNIMSVGTVGLLSVFHLVALLLVLGIGLNYALFFERVAADVEERSRTRLALAVCSTSTIVTFGFLALSSTPVLHAIGSTVALGAVLALAMSALWAGRRPPGPGAWHG